MNKKYSLFNRMILYLCIACPSLLFASSDRYIKSPIGTAKRVVKKILKNDKFDFDFSGHVSLESFYDSRQVKGQFHDEYVFYPLDVNFDKRCLDINGKDQLSMTAIHVYGRVEVKGPDVWGAKSSSKIEAKFTGVNDSTIRLFRLNKGIINFDWGKTKLLLGHYYHPIGRDKILGREKFYPITLGTGYGIGFDPFAYVAQARVRHVYRNFEFVFAVFKHYKSEIARFAVTPDLFCQFTANMGKHYFGFGMDYHVEVPRLQTDEGFMTTQQLGSVHPFIFAILNINKLKIRSRFIYSENGRTLGILGSYATKCRDPETDERILTNLRALNVWADIVYTGKRVEPAIFLGFSKNIGASCNIIKSYIDDQGKDVPLLDVEGGVNNTDYRFIAAPRVRFRFGPMVVGAELEYFRVAYARRNFDEENWQNDYDSRGKIICSRVVSNTRLLVTTRYYF